MQSWKSLPPWTLCEDLRLPLLSPLSSLSTKPGNHRILKCPSCFSHCSLLLRKKNHSIRCCIRRVMLDYTFRQQCHQEKSVVHGFSMCAKILDVGVGLVISISGPIHSNMCKVMVCWIQYRVKTLFTPFKHCISH